MLVRGGYPEAQRQSPRGLGRFFASYVESLLARDIADVASIREPRHVDRVLRLIAARSGSIVNVNGVASELGIDRATVSKHVQILESLFLIRQLGAWQRNLGSRLVKSPKAYVVDCGLLAIVGVEVKAAATPRSGDFTGLRYLRDRLGSRFKAGVLIYTGSQTLPFGDRLAAVPVSGLWD